MQIDWLKAVQLLALAVPHVEAALERLKQENPNLTDDEAIELFREDSKRLIDEGLAWLAAHPKPV